MFTPPPSPLPPRRKSPPSPLSQQVDLSSDELEYSPYEDDDSQPSTPIYAELSEKASTPPPIRVPPGPSRNSAKSARRRILIPLVAIVLVLVAAASSRYDVNLKWRTPSTSTGRPQPPSTDVPVAGFGAESGEHVAGHSHDPNRTSRSPGTHGHHNRKPRIGLSNHWNPTPSSTSSEELDKRGADELDAVQLAADTTSPSIPDPPYPVPTPFPQPFDTTFSYNFTTSSCQSWFANSLLANLTFRQCRPLSLLLPASAAFFQAQSNLTTLTAVIGGTCATVRSADDCTGTMSWLASEIQKDTVCGLDLKAKNAMALEALNGFRNYQFMREAGCLINQRTNSYCLVDAVASSSPVDFYFYTLPLGTPLPNKTTPSCSTCVESLLSIYATEAGNKTLDIAKTYPGAASKAIDVCGANYATIPSGVSLSGAMGLKLASKAGVRILSKTSKNKIPRQEPLDNLPSRLDLQFGSTTGATGLFGRPATSSGAFGSSTTPTTTTGGLFGSKPVATTTTTGLDNTGSGTTPAGTINGTARPTYQVTFEREGSDRLRVVYLAITCMPAYKNHSFEELRLQDYTAGLKSARRTGFYGTRAFGSTATPGPAYQVTLGKDVRGPLMVAYQAITCMPAYKNYSFEELRLQYYTAELTTATSTGFDGTGAFGSAAIPVTTAGNNGQTKTQATTGGLFGQNTPQQRQQPAAGGFGTTGSFRTGGGSLGQHQQRQPQQQRPQQATTGGLFGQQPAQQTQLAQNNQQQQQPQQQPQSTGLFAGSLFGPKPTEPVIEGLFGNTPKTLATGISLFRENTRPAQTDGGLFGGLGASTAGQQQQQQQQTAGLFSQRPTGSGLFESITTGTGGGLFGSTTATPVASNGSVFFGSQGSALNGGLLGQSPQPLIDLLAGTPTNSFATTTASDASQTTPIEEDTTFTTGSGVKLSASIVVSDSPSNRS
ncbi:hypothetical protein FRC04_008484 [Tulasnella sp. 424]|nr:hypothetical protein FRC04_008484 [Tulasnella sp. 424]